MEKIALITALLAIAFQLILCIWVKIGLSKLKPLKLSNLALIDLPEITVLVCFRNEENNLNKLILSLENQLYPIEKLKLLFINDHSIDNSVSIIQNYNGNLNIELHHLENQFGKKYAFSYGLKQVKTEWLACTDADCEPVNTWIESLYDFAITNDKKLVAAPLVYNKSGLIASILNTELSSLLSVTAASFGHQNALMCNGANLFINKSLYITSSIDSLSKNNASGDDMFLLQNAKLQSNSTLDFCFDSKALVKTEIVKSFGEFINQRIRWASKWKTYQDKSQFWAGPLVWISQLFWILLLMFNLEFKVILLSFGIKLLIDYVFLQQMVVLMQFENIKTFKLHWILTSILHPFYVVIFGVLSFIPKYKWKDRICK